MSILQKDLDIELPLNWERYSIKTNYMGCGEESEEFFGHMLKASRSFDHELYYTRGLNPETIRTIFYNHFDSKFNIVEEPNQQYTYCFRVYYEGHQHTKFIIYIMPTKRTGTEPYI